MTTIFIKGERILLYFFNKLFNPEIFQGKNKKRSYFEGWYYKVIDHSMQHALAIIPGISIGRGSSDSHAFIQVLDALGCQVNYARFPASLFKYNTDRFEVEIGDNYFSAHEMEIGIAEIEFSISGRLRFKNIIPFPKTLFRPGIMGPYGFVPFMECYHGIINVHQELTGLLSINGNPTDFSEGYGYVEKDWGSSFPEAWIWLQSNHFGPDNVSLMFSTAKIPWLGRYFTGLISFIRINDRLLLFATYTKAAVKKLEYRDNCLDIVVEDKNHRMSISAVHSDGGLLKAPKNGLMEDVVLESINASVHVRLSDKAGRIIYEGNGSHTGMEIANDIFQYFM